VRLGVAGTRLEYLLLLVVAYSMALILVFVLGSPWLLAPIITVPRAIMLYTTVRHATDGPTLNRTLAGTAQLSLLYAIVLAVALQFG
jgi:1,4-dihydroxy-2-naphthoate polyprenyltransferase